MTIAVPTPVPPSSPPDPRRVAPALDGLVLNGVSWETYERLRDELDDARQRVYITYDDGRMVLMSPRPEHERWKRLTGRLVETLTLELNIPIASLGSATWRRRDVKKGLEADECYYIQHEKDVRGKLDIDLRRDPPPDLAIEVELTNHPADREGVYAGLGVPELWHYDGEHFTCFLLGPDRKYASSETSGAFPFLRPSDLAPFLDKLKSADENSIIRSFQEWVRTNVRIP